MSKRTPTSALNQDNWNDDAGSEDPGTGFVAANQSTLKERVILKARRKKETSCNGSGSAFSGFSNKFTSQPVAEEPVVEKVEEAKKPG